MAKLEISQSTWHFHIDSFWLELKVNNFDKWTILFIFGNYFGTIITIQWTQINELLSFFVHGVKSVENSLIKFCEEMNNVRSLVKNWFWVTPDPDSNWTLCVAKHKEIRPLFIHYQNIKSRLPLQREPSLICIFLHPSSLKSLSRWAFSLAFVLLLGLGVIYFIYLVRMQVSNHFCCPQDFAHL